MFKETSVSERGKLLTEHSFKELVVSKTGKSLTEQSFKVPSGVNAELLAAII